MPARYEPLDAMRIACTAIVVAFHFPAIAFGWKPASGYLAVDLFFMLSGFLIAGTYSSRLTERGTAGPFLINRLVRFVPLHLVALVIGTGLAATALLVGRQYNGIVDPGTALLPAIAFIPAGAGYVFALNPPAWSLALELVANAVFALSARHLTNERLIAAVGVTAAVLAMGVTANGTADLGASHSTLLLGVVRAAYGFGAGVLLSRLRMVIKPPKAIVLMLPVALAMMMARPVWGGLYDLTFLAIVAPLTIWAGSISMPSLVAAPRIAEATFAAYILHFPILFAATHVLGDMRGGMPIMLTIIVICSIAGKALAKMAYQRCYNPATKRAVLSLLRT